MKYLSLIIIIGVFCIAPAFGQADAISKYFDQYVEDEQFTMVYISPKMFNLISRLDIDEMDDEEAALIMDVIGDLKGLRVLTTEHNAMKYYNEAISKINTDEYDLLMAVRDHDENVRFMIKDDGKIISELLLLVGGDDFVLVSFVGKIDLNKISQLSKVIEINGTEHLEKLGDQEDTPAKKQY